MSIESGAQKLCQKGLDFRRQGGLGEEGYNFAVKVVGDFVVVGVVQGNP